jgi:hypothetical protein
MTDFTSRLNGWRNNQNKNISNDIEPEIEKESFFSKFGKKAGKIFKKTMATGLIMVMGTGALISAAHASDSFQNTGQTQKTVAMVEEGNHFGQQTKMLMNIDNNAIKNTQITADKIWINLETGKLDIENAVFSENGKIMIRAENATVNGYSVDKFNNVSEMDVIFQNIKLPQEIKGFLDSNKNARAIITNEGISIFCQNGKNDPITVLEFTLEGGVRVKIGTGDISTDPGSEDFFKLAGLQYHIADNGEARKLSEEPLCMASLTVNNEVLGPFQKVLNANNDLDKSYKILENIDQLKRFNKFMEEGKRIKEAKPNDIKFGYDKDNHIKTIAHDNGGEIGVEETDTGFNTTKLSAFMGKGKTFTGIHPIDDDSGMGM